jgi:hypothetical protein
MVFEPVDEPQIKAIPMEDTGERAFLLKAFLIIAILAVLLVFTWGLFFVIK